MYFSVKCVCLLLGFGILESVLAGSYSAASVFINNGKTDVKYGVLDKTATAYGYFNDTLLINGWGILEISSGYGRSNSDDELMYAAGYLEGILTARQIWYNYENLYKVMLGKQPSNVIDKVKKFYDEQNNWANNMLLTHKSSDPYWQHFSYISSQFYGLVDGYKKIAEKQGNWSTDIFVLQLLNGMGDLIDLIQAVQPNNVPDYDKMSHSQLLSYINNRGHCSALIKVTGAFENIFMAHSSWFIYSSTNRIYKHYNFNIANKVTKLKKLSFSSYPGFLESLDDFYILGNNMVLLQTTNNVPDKSMYQYVVPQALYAWQRMRIALMMSSSGQEWYLNFKKYNSGTYNNQYMVIDLKRVVLGKSLEDGALWVIEQMPSLVVGADKTEILRTGYWPSYNVPFFEEIYNKSGYPAFVDKYGTDMSYQLAPRAKIFRRDQGLVHDLTSMKHIMRYDDFKQDPYSEDDACNAICCRGDLSKAGPMPDGCYDSKVTDFHMALKMHSVAINGPTLGDSLPPFTWKEFPNVPHLGLPQSYNFSWIDMQPSL